MREERLNAVVKLEWGLLTIFSYLSAYISKYQKFKLLNNSI